MFFESHIKIALNIISPSLRKKYNKVLIFNLINVILDVFTLISIYPLVSNLVGKGSSKIDSIIENIIQFFGIDLIYKTQFIFYFFIIMIIFKNIILIYIKYLTVQTIEQIFQEVSKKLFLNITSKSFLKFTNFKQSVTLKNIREIPLEFKNYLDIYLNYYVCLLNILIITTSLVFFNFKVTISILIYVFLMSIIYKYLFSNKAVNWGKKGNFMAGKIYTNILDTINLIHEIKLHNRVSFFFKKHQNLISVWSDMIFKNKFISSITRPIFEIFLILPLFLMMIFINKSSISLEILPILSIYLYAAFRTLPSLINLNISKLRQKNYLFAVEYLHNQFKNQSFEIKNDEDYSIIKNFKFKDKISLKNISFKFPSSDKSILKNINLDIFKYDFIGIKGKSGVGKSTLVKIILGLIEPTHGKIVVDNQINVNDVRAQYMNSMSYVSQNLSLINDSIANNVAFGVPKEEIDEENIWKALTLASAERFTKNLENKIDYQITNNGQNLSGGQSQRIAIARALYHDPKIIILDEATNSLDNLTEQRFIQDLKKLKNKVTIISISHQQESLDFCDKVYELNENELKIV